MYLKMAILVVGFPLHKPYIQLILGIYLMFGDVVYSQAWLLVLGARVVGSI